MTIKNFTQQDEKLFNTLKIQFPEETEHWSNTYKEIFKYTDDQILIIQTEMRYLKEKWNEINSSFERNLEKMKDEIEQFTGVRPVYNRDEHLHI